MSDLEAFNTDEGWKGWIDSAGSELSAIAWDHFLATGRGVFFIDFTTASSPSENIVDVAVAFVREDRLLAKANEWDFRPGFFSNLLELVYTYDPKQEFVFCLRQPNRNFASGVVSCNPTPPEAYLQCAGKRPDNIIEATFNN